MLSNNKHFIGEATIDTIVECAKDIPTNCFIYTTSKELYDKLRVRFPFRCVKLTKSVEMNTDTHTRYYIVPVDSNAEMAKLQHTQPDNCVLWTYNLKKPHEPVILPLGKEAVSL